MLSFASPLAILAIVAVAILASAAISRWSPYFHRLVSGRGARLASLDGLRGFLALGVFIHHASITRLYLATGQWVVPQSVIYAYLGGGCVSLFFMASGFLFWAKAIDKKIDVERLLISRFWRVMPMYWATMLVVFAVAGSLSNWTLRVDPIYLRRELAFWLMGGYFSVASVNGIPTVVINAGVTWSLLYEWWFYFSLPILAIFATPKRFTVGLVGFFVLRSISARYLPEYHVAIQLSTGFAFGMLMAHLVRLERFRRWMTKRSVAIGALLYLAGCLWYNDSHRLAPISYEVMSLPLFAAVSCGNNFYRVLTRPWTLLLGHVSYSVYLAHGLLLYFLVQRALGATVVASMTPIRYWGWIVLAVTPLVVLAASLTYRFIEAPFLKRASLSLRPMERKPSVVLSGQT